MEKKQQHIIIVSFSVFLFFLLSYYNFTFKNTITLFIIMCSEIYHRKYLKYKKKFMDIFTNLFIYSNSTKICIDFKRNRLYYF